MQCEKYGLIFGIIGILFFIPFVIVARNQTVNIWFIIFGFVSAIGSSLGFILLLWVVVGSFYMDYD